MKISKILASGLGSGYSPVAPGTAGSIVGIVLLYIFNWFMIVSGFDKAAIYLLNLLAIILSIFL